MPELAVVEKEIIDPSESESHRLKNMSCALEGNRVRCDDSELRLVDHLDEQSVLQLEEVLRNLRHVLLQLAPRSHLLNIQGLVAVAEDGYEQTQHVRHLSDRTVRTLDSLEFDQHCDVKLFY